MDVYADDDDDDDGDDDDDDDDYGDDGGGGCDDDGDGVMLGSAFSVKFVGLFVILLVSVKDVS